MVAIQIAMALSFSVSGPFLPLLIGELGVHPLSSVEAWSGTITATYSLMAAVLAPLWGLLADRTGRKAMVVRSCFAACVFNGLAGLAQNQWQLFAVRAIAGMFGGYSVAAMALVGTQVPEERLGFSLGWLSTATLLGTLMGPLLGGVLADLLHDYRAVFFWTSAGAFLSAVACTAFVHEAGREQIRHSEHRQAPFWVQLGTLVTHRQLLPLVVVIILGQVTARAVQPIVPLFAQHLVGQSPWLATFAGASLAVTGIAGVIASPFLGRRSDRIGYRRVLTISLVGAATFTLPQGLVTSIWVFLVLRFGVGVFLGGILPTANAWVGRLFPRERRGQAYGLVSSAQFLGGFLGPLTGGFTAAHFGFNALFLEIGLLMIANLAWIVLATRTDAPVLAGEG